MSLNAFLFRPPGDDADGSDGPGVPTHGTTALHEQHPRFRARYMLCHLSGTLPAAQPYLFNQSTFLTSIASSAPSVASLGLRCVTPTYKGWTRRNSGRALWGNDEDVASPTGASLSSSSLQAGDSGPGFANTLNRLTRALFSITKDNRAGDISQTVYSVPTPASVKRLLPTPQAAASLTETTNLSLATHYTNFSTQAVVPLTGTTSLFLPPPPPDLEPYTTGQTR
ncbi:uncharacterized protein ALTATR162_LOCUS6941 [Alternaria atra]|uniref:Uncharacterized protein n=1 Tax=Alternaria atra TaxID=119953 RepID=A0A8J2N321_9PLEO|nr:uncharacterized protein ALTATR162_LOCUS6941 [Alternaria atra]CAG5166540.1 unnamed protein product [Alternaria atra]